jgi:hypothetical protein
MVQRGAHLGQDLAGQRVDHGAGAQVAVQKDALELWLLRPRSHQCGEHLNAATTTRSSSSAT